jgi:vacuolar-type H+-ATPase subunit D/Vma8
MHQVIQQNQIRANALSYYILWNTRSRTKNIELFKKKFNL